jgi:mono/diheme cytochrome c family protein
MSTMCSTHKGSHSWFRPRFLPIVAVLVTAFWARPIQAAHETTPEREAWYLVKQRCYLCHFIDQQDVRWGAKWGPSLKGFFKKQDAKLLNGKAINDQTVAEWINEGSQNMPAFKYTLDARQVGLIITYLKGGFPNAPRQDGTPQQATK